MPFNLRTSFSAYLIVLFSAICFVKVWGFRSVAIAQTSMSLLQVRCASSRISPSDGSMSVRSSQRNKASSKRRKSVSDETIISKRTAFLKSWLLHNENEFHSFSKDEADAIRESLLVWYRSNRRKLPWRGDEPPWGGSTIAFAAKASAVSSNKKQASLKEFFATSVVNLSATKRDEDVDAPDDHKKSFPVTAYGVWVSEIMLQQTRVEAVVPYWVRWMIRFPTVHDLALADEDAVNAHWAGLGFYRRARLLHSAAKYIVNDCNGALPENVQELLHLPGVGRYTASAIASIAFNVNVPVVDGNVCRVLARLRGIANNIKAPALKDNHGWDLAAQIVSAGDGSAPGEVNQAIMELGATYCAPGGTGLDENDPLKDFYFSTRIGREVLRAFDGNDLKQISELRYASSNAQQCSLCAHGGVAEVFDILEVELSKALESKASVSRENIASKCGHSSFPLSPPKLAKREEVLAVGALKWLGPNTMEPAWLLHRRPEKGLLAGQWEFPSVCVWTSETVKPKGKRKNSSDRVPIVSACVRRKALESLLRDVASTDKKFLDCWASAMSLKQCPVGEGPIEHIFSHVRHTMWIESVDLSQALSLSIMDGVQLACAGREMRWMTESQMKEVGVTSGVRKILKSLEQKNPKKRKNMVD
ncbi:predicted protein [Phaeodactylum tricornutum CCAP 1055/1]|jgi:A/G-specific adenine glycosylase|uniref:Adenine DNA glycosylase n=1 Tax=Phaeodactylum tricornutum (strain CCAP 1055/1) TaxID=556484 RepID=B7G7W7_PHATC|nr:predicted protein [Phaeodactylum tricornutum CCAP 1055/1]EEC45437.1 predicted protein [Phaeodactylum tricornutum CCAP 1055/1]|eukprot:XP_002183219.1 predicted protein [Phaeodactylum tricornutum CCAP 1055/1]